jgi:hypothetical protein
VVGSLCHLVPVHKSIIITVILMLVVSTMFRADFLLVKDRQGSQQPLTTKTIVITAYLEIMAGDLLKIKGNQEYKLLVLTTPKSVAERD